MLLSAPLFLDSPGATPYLVFVAKPDHKIGYPDPIPPPMKRSESMDLNVPAAQTSPASAGLNAPPRARRRQDPSRPPAAGVGRGPPAEIRPHAGLGERPDGA